MPEKPNNDLEKLLSDYAKQRRDAAGTPQLHPATRRMLQSEVKQRFGRTGKSTPTREPAGWLRFWPRIVAACGLVAVLGTVMLLSTQSGDKTAKVSDLALLKKDADANAFAEKSAAPASAPAPAAYDAADARSDAAPRQEAVAAGVTSEAATASSMQVAKSFGMDADTKLDAVASAETETRATSRSLSATPMPPSARPVFGDATGGSLASSELKPAPGKPTELQREADGYGQLENPLNQRYRNIAVTDKAKEATAVPVLDEFTVEQSGQVLTVVDRDGSVYNGFVQAAPADAEETKWNYAVKDEVAPLAETLKPATPAAQARAKDAAADGNRAQSGPRLGGMVDGAQIQNLNEAQNYFFRVEGTNRTLKQRVVFTGNLIQNYAAPESQAAPASAFPFKQQETNQPRDNSGRLQYQMQNNFINGRVLLGDSKAGTELNALSVGP